jgi:catechol 2,3-dioxygenase-like lactoylglutathione lyase family enzyme
MVGAFDCVFYYVSDLSRSVQFYRETLGFRLISYAAVAKFDLDGILFELVPSTDSARLKARAGLALKVDDILATVAELRRGGVQASAPQNKEGGILSSFEDPDGNMIYLWQYAASPE